MKNSQQKINIFFIIIILFIVFDFSIKNTFAASSSNFKIEILSFCGNNIREGSEVCDGTDLNGRTCQNFGLSGSNLRCYGDCTFNPTQCSPMTTTTTTAGGGGGGGGGISVPAYVPPVVETAVIFSGRAYPQSKVNILKDGQIATSTIAGPDSNFYVSLSGLSSGNYNFAVYGEDSNKVRSALFTFPVFVSNGATTKISGIFIAPTISIDKTEVKWGDNIVIFGQSVPKAKVTVNVNSDNPFFMQTQTDKDGMYLLRFDTSMLTKGHHSTRSKTVLDSEVSSYSGSLDFIVGNSNVLVKPNDKCPVKGNLNNDCKVNIVDFSIAAFWYKRVLSDNIRIIEREKLNNDGKIDLKDFSVMAFHWSP